jgi:hypothetical protein
MFNIHTYFLVKIKNLKRFDYPGMRMRRRSFLGSVLLRLNNCGAFLPGRANSFESLANIDQENSDELSFLAGYFHPAPQSGTAPHEPAADPQSMKRA